MTEPGDLAESGAVLDAAAARRARAAMGVLLVGVGVKLLTLLVGVGLATAAGIALAAAVLIVASVLARGLGLDDPAAARLRKAPMALGAGLVLAIGVVMGLQPQDEPVWFAVGSAASGVAVAVGGVAYAAGVRRWLDAAGEGSVRRWWTGLAVLTVLSYGVLSTALGALLILLDPAQLLAAMEAGEVDVSEPGSGLAMIAMVGFVSFLVALVQLAVEAVAAIGGLRAVKRAGAAPAS